MVYVHFAISTAIYFTASCSIAPQVDSDREAAISNRSNANQTKTERQKDHDHDDFGNVIDKDAGVVIEDENGQDDDSRPAETVKNQPPTNDNKGADDSDLPQKPTTEPPTSDPYVVNFEIPADYDGSAPINTLGQMLKLKVYPGDKKQELVITNLSNQSFRLHTGGAPCPHQPGGTDIDAGESYSCVVSQVLTVDPNANGAATYDHNKGRSTSLFMEATNASDP